MQRLLYLLPDVAYVADLTAAKKPHSYTVRAFRQINGEFIKKQTLQKENLGKLFSKLDKDSYTLVLPDEAFACYMVDAPEKAETKVREYVENETFAKNNISAEDLIQITPLTHHQNITKTQVTALKYAIAETLANLAKEHDLQLDQTIPLSWSLKSLISLEPSLSLAQLGNYLYLGFHYIGVDLCEKFSLSDTDVIANKISDVKEKEPSTQTIYLATNQLVEQEIKSALQSIIPIQQTTIINGSESDLPQHLKNIFAHAARTLSITDYQMPIFKVMRIKPRANINETTDETNESYIESTNSLSETDEKTPLSNNESDEPLPKPSATPIPIVDANAALAAAAVVGAVGTINATTGNSIIDEENSDDLDSLFTEHSNSVPDNVSDIDENINDENEENDNENVDDQELNTSFTLTSTQIETSLSFDNDDENDSSSLVNSEENEELQAETDETDELIETTTSIITETISIEENQDTQDDIVEESIDSTQSNQEDNSNLTTSNQKLDSTEDEELTTHSSEENIPDLVANSPKEPHKPNLALFAPGGSSKSALAETNMSDIPTKPNDAVSGTSVMKMIFVTLTVLFITVAVGVGIGLGVLSLSGDNQQADNSPVVVATPSPAPSPLPSPTPEPITIDRSEVKALVVNATTVAGKAGKTKSALEAAEFEGVKTGNAKGDYDDGSTYIQLKDKDSQLDKLFAEVLDTELTADDNIKIEDPKGEYDVVIVLADPAN